jgi:hypothetical protein
MPRTPSDATEFQAKVTDDNGMTRGKIPSPLLRKMGARPGDYMKFRLATSGDAIMRLSPTKGAGRAVRRGGPKTTKRR